MNNPQATVAPVIETQRTILRAHRLEDFDAYAAMWADPVVTRFIGGKPRTREESWMRFLRHALSGFLIAVFLLIVFVSLDVMFHLDRAGRWVVLASGRAEANGDDALPIRADARVSAATLKAGDRITYPCEPSRHLYMVAPVGRIRVNGHGAQPRDGVAITGETQITVEALDDAELVLVDAR